MENREERITRYKSLVDEMFYAQFTNQDKDRDISIESALKGERDLIIWLS